MTIMLEIKGFEGDLKNIFEDLHAHPEIGFKETRTAAIVAEKLREYGVDEVHSGIGGTGVVGLIRGRQTGMPPPILAPCMPAATTGIRPCCSGRRATWPQPAILTELL
jgi:metal-dependent amidase/aminoacylase/carboxypeptidase family protein